MKYFVTASGTPTPETMAWWPMGTDGRRTFGNQGGAQEAPTTFDSKEDADRWIGTAFSRMSGGALSDPRPEPYTGRLWMNPATGTVAAYHEWWYENEDGDLVNAVDHKEVEAVEWNGETNEWEGV